MFRIWMKIPFYDVVFLFVSNSSLGTSLKWISPVARFCGKRMIVKKFGGMSHYELPPPAVLSPGDRQRLTAILRQVDLYMPQTRYAYEVAIRDGIPSLWLPNFRELPKIVAEDRHEAFCNVFSLLYVGIVMPEKGIREIIAADPLLKPGITIDVYGGFQGMSLDDFAELKQVRYCGELKKEDVIPTMRHYDAFIFPSYYPSEGHPGVLIEAFAAGLPVITTNRPFIYEIATEGNSLIIEAQNVTQLVEAVHRLADDPHLRKTLSQKALERSRFFDAGYWMDVMRNCIVHVARGETIPDRYLNPDRLEQDAMEQAPKAVNFVS